MGLEIGQDEWSKKEDMLKSAEAESRIQENSLKQCAQELFQVIPDL